MKNVIKWSITLFFIAVFITSIYIKRAFQFGSFEQLLFTILYSKGTSFVAIIKPIISIVCLIIVAIILLIIITKIYKSYIQNKYLLKIKIRNKNYKIRLFRNGAKRYKIYLLFFWVVMIYFTTIILGVNEYLSDQFKKTTLFEDYFVVLDDEDIVFPEKKKNLIYIFVESLESTSVSEDNGGYVKKSYIPNLEKIALNNINFSNSNKIGGALDTYGAAYTAGSMVAQTSGVPLKLKIDGNKYTGYSDSLPGLNTLGDILEKNGYDNYLLLGSDATFGGRRDYFTSHGNYKIMDYLYAKDNNWIDNDYYQWWGYEDKKLFEFAKEQLKSISKQERPFNFSILTADTHFVDGYLDKDCPNVFPTQYENAFYCSDLKINNFVEWLKKQDFYKNTILIICGDHLTMQSGFYKDIDYQRTIYNSFLNTKMPSDNVKNRLFTSFDMFPTTLAALNVKVRGEKLGLGVNLFSGEKTLVEKLGYDFFNGELSKKSFFYDNHLLKETYYEMEKELNNKKIN